MVKRNRFGIAVGEKVNEIGMVSPTLDGSVRSSEANRTLS
jgi:hypothetical protein